MSSNPLSGLGHMLGTPGVTNTAVDAAAIALFVGTWLSLTKPFVDAFSLRVLSAPDGSPLQTASVRLWGFLWSVVAVVFVLYAPATAVAGFYAVVAVLAATGLYHISTQKSGQPAASDVEAIVSAALSRSTHQDS